MNIYDFNITKIDGTDKSLKDYKGKILLIVNTATGCGLTPQYEAIESLYKKYKENGLEIIDLPSNQFLNQAPESNEEIAKFCTSKYNTTFETFAKVDVNGENEIPLYTFLKAEKPNDTDNGGMQMLHEKLKGIFEVGQNDIQWNFTKFLVDTEGNVINRYAPTVTPEELEKDIIKLIG